MQRCRSNKKNGFSVIEMLVAVAVLSVSLLGLAQLVGLSLQQNDFARYNTSAIEVARGKLEELKALYNWQLATGGASDELADGDHGPVTVVLHSDDGSYGERSLSIWWQVASPSTTRKDVVISVSPATASRQLVSKTVTINTTLSP